MSEHTAEYWQTKAYASLEAHDYQAAINYLQKAYELAPQHTLIVLQMAQVYHTLANRKKSISLLQRHLQQQEHTPDIYFYLGTLWYAEKNWQEAIQCFEQTIKLQAHHVDAYYYLGLSYLATGKKSLAHTALHSLLTLDKNHSAAQFQLGILAMQNAHYELAQTYFAELARRFPKHQESLVNLATCYFQLGKFDLAEQYYQQALTLDEHDLQSLYNLAVLSEKNGRLDQAEAYYMRLCAQNPNYAEAQHNWGVLLLKQNKKEEALIHFFLAEKNLPLAQREHLIAMLRGDALARASTEYIEQLFDGYAPYYEEHLIRELKYAVPKHLYDLVASISTNQTWKILDLGCGTGMSVEHFKAQTILAVGVDLSKAMLDIAKKKNIYHALHQEDVQEFLMRNTQVFNLILAADVLVYFGELTELFASIYHAAELSGSFAFNIEIAKDEIQSYQLTQTGRFVHAIEYVEMVLQKSNWKIQLKEKFILRENRGMPVWGMSYVCVKENAPGLN